MKSEQTLVASTLAIWMLLLLVTGHFVAFVLYLLVIVACYYLFKGT